MKILVVLVAIAIMLNQPVLSADILDKVNIKRCLRNEDTELRDHLGELLFLSFSKAGYEAEIASEHVKEYIEGIARSKFFSFRSQFTVDDEYLMLQVTTVIKSDRVILTTIGDDGFRIYATIMVEPELCNKRRALNKEGSNHERR